MIGLTLLFNVNANFKSQKLNQKNYVQQDNTLR